MQRNAVYILVLGVLGLIVIGLVALSSTSPFSDDKASSQMYYTLRQAMWLGVGAVICVMAALIDYHWWQRFVWVIVGIAIVLLACCYLPGIGLRINSSARWINIGIGTFQPSEFAKYATIAFLAFWYSKYYERRSSLLYGLILPAAVVVFIMLLIVCEVDFGATLLIGATTAIIMFLAGAGLRFLVPLGVIGVLAIAIAIQFKPERMDRIMAFKDLEAHRLGAGLQQYEGLIAFGSGGVDGLGLGNGRQKMMYLPYAHTDFIFPIIGEELGMKFTLLVVFVFFLIFVCGMMIAVNARDRFGRLMGIGISCLIGIQAAVNIGVTTAILPNKGLPLPFISYGGSNLMMCLLGIGLLINIHIQGRPVALPQPKRHHRVRVLHRI